MPYGQHLTTHTLPKNISPKNNGGLADRRAYGSSVHEPNQPILDQVDFGREIARDLEANFLLAHGRLRPNLHDVSSN